MSKLPIACSLSEHELEDVVAHYSRAAERYQAVVRYQADRAHIDLRGEKPALKVFLDDMVAREERCCSHLRFDVSEQANGYSVDLRVSEGSGANPGVTLRQVIPILFPAAEAA